MMLDRRQILQAGLLGAVTPGFLSRLAFGAAESNKVLVVVMLRGAVDGLSVVVPHTDPAYYAARPTIAIARPDDSGKPESERLLRLDDRFGLHPAMAPLHAAFMEKRLAFVHAAGSPAATRSHFDAQDFMESGTPDKKSTDNGFLNRLLAASRGPDNPLRAIAVTNAMPRIMSGDVKSVVFTRLSDLSLGGGKSGVATGATFEAMYAAAVQDALRAPTGEVFDVSRKLEKAGVAKMKPENGAVYPPNDAYGRGLSEIAALIKADVGVQVAFTDIGGWDTHAAQGAGTGQLARRLDVFARGLSAFATDLGKRMDNVVVVALSEFGRTVRENGSRGTDHGHGNFMLVAHGAVKGGQVYGKWPGLAEDALFEKRDLAVTTDFRDVLWRVAEKHMRTPKLETVFPGFKPSAAASHLALI